MALSSHAQIIEPQVMNYRSRTAPAIESFQANQRTYQWTVLNGTDPVNLAGNEPFLYWHMAGHEGIVPATITVIDASNGVFNASFAPADLNPEFMGSETIIVSYVVGVDVTGGPTTARNGTMRIHPDPRAAGVDVTQFTKTIAWANYESVGLPDFMGVDAIGDQYAWTGEGWAQVDTPEAGISDLDSFDTDDLAEGATNLYFTSHRAIDAGAGTYAPLSVYQYDGTNATISAALGVLPDQVKSASATSVGIYAAAFGGDTTAGDYGAAFGLNTTAGDAGAAFGVSTTAGDAGAAFGEGTTAGNLGFSAGWRGKGADGSFVFADSQNIDFNRTAHPDSFSVRAQGGTYFDTPTFEVTGDVTATSFTGDGSGLTGVAGGGTVESDVALIVFDGGPDTVITLLGTTNNWQQSIIGITNSFQVQMPLKSSTNEAAQIMLTIENTGGYAATWVTNQPPIVGFVPVIPTNAVSEFLLWSPARDDEWYNRRLR